MSSITIKIVPGAPIEMHVEGIPGGGCKSASKAYLDMLPGQTISDKPTAEAMLPPAQTQQTVNLGR